MNELRDGYCLRTPSGVHVHVFANLSFELCPDDQYMAFAYQPAAIARWLLSEGFEMIFEPDYQLLEVEL